jgi:peptidoglycan/LPS O-acetylase OafA/YrhL
MSVVAACTIAIFSAGNLGGLNGVWDAVAVIFAIPLIIAGTAHLKISGRAAAAAALLGDLSYPVYILHWPLRFAIFSTGIQDKIPEAAFLALSSVLICFISFVVMKLYDEPLRKLLKSKLFRGTPAPVHPATAP